MLSDLRYALRMLLKSPGFTAVVVLTLAMGFGLNTSMFTLFNAVALRSVPGVRDPDQLYVCTSGPREIYYSEYEYLREHNQSFSGLTASSSHRFTLGDAIKPGEGSTLEDISVRVVAGDYFGVLGADPPSSGRYFLPDEYGTSANTTPVIVLSHRFWRQHLNSDPQIVGKTLSLSGAGFTVVGVAPESFRGREPTTKGPDAAPDAWSPLLLKTNRADLERYTRMFHLYARLKGGVTATQAEKELAVLTNQLVQTWPAREREMPGNIPDYKLYAGFPTLVPERDVWENFGFVMTLLVLVLLIACANVANLLLARAAERQKEIATRQALGASRARLIRQFLTESVVLGILGGFAGLLAGYWATPVWRMLMVEAMPHNRSFVEELDLSPDLRVAAFTFGLSIFAGLIFGLVPAFDLLRFSLLPALKDEATLAGTRIRRSWLRNTLIVGQVAVSICLTIGAALCARSVRNALSREYDFNTRNVLLVELRLPYSPLRTQDFHRQYLEKIAALPGVQSIGMTTLPDAGQPRSTILLEGSESQPLKVSFFGGNNYFSPSYFQTIQLPIVQGRNFTEEDVRSAEPIAIVSESMARQYWPGQNAVGRRFRLGSDTPMTQVIGVARDGMPPEMWKSAPGGLIKYYASTFAGDLYLPLRPDNPNLNMASVVVRCAGDAKALIPLVRREALRLDPQIFVSANVLRKIMDSELDGPVGVFGLAGSGLGLLALTLATMGIYGVMAYVVSRRTHEIGVRMAMAAQRGHVLRMIVGQGMRVVGVGIALGFVGGLGLARLLASQLFGLSPFDPIAFAGVTSIAIAAGLLACFVPARRAARVDPMVALRCE